MNNQVFNRDCLEAMREYPDNAFDLAVVDPPYGAGFTEGGGCQGWFAKYHNEDDSQIVNVERERTRPQWNRFGGRFDRYKTQDTDKVRTLGNRTEHGDLHNGETEETKNRKK